MGPPGRGGAWGRAPQCDRSVLGGGLGGRTPPPFPSRAILQLGTLSPGGAVPALVQVFTDPSAPSPHPPRRRLCSGEQVAHLQGLPCHDRDPGTAAQVSRSSSGRRRWLVTQSCLTLCDPMDCSPQAPLSMGFPRQEYRSGNDCRSTHIRRERNSLLTEDSRLMMQDDFFLPFPGPLTHKDTKRRNRETGIVGDDSLSAPRSGGWVRPAGMAPSGLRLRTERCAVPPVHFWSAALSSWAA